MIGIVLSGFIGLCVGLLLNVVITEIKSAKEHRNIE